MDAIPVTFLACLVGSFGGRAHLTVAMLANSLGRSWTLLLISIFTALATTFVMAFVGAALATQLVAEARYWLIIGAILLAVLELSLPVRHRHAEEPTRSFVAVALALMTKQVFDAPRFCVFASAAAFASIDQAMIGGGLAVFVSSIAIWSFAGRQVSPKTRYAIRLAVAATFLSTTLFIGSIDQ